MDNPFRYSRLRVARANKCILELETEIKTFFFGTVPYPFAIKSYPEKAPKVLLWVTKPMPDSFTTVTVDAIDNLRSTLDLGWHAIAVSSGARKPTEKAYFPIGKSAVDLDNLIQNGCKNFRREIISLLRTFHPYKGGNDLLWALHRECNRNKHEILTWVSMWIGAKHLPLSVSAGSEEARITGFRWDNRKNEIIIDAIADNALIEYNVKLCFNEAFYESDFTAGEPALTVLRHLARIIENIINNLELTARRLGFI